jgi:O-antigen/teichoic acid export membrane protein
MSSYRNILRSSLLIGGSSAVNIATGIAKMKVAALILGPTGIGLIGMLQNLMQMSGQLASLGVQTSGARRIAATREDGGQGEIALVRRAILVGALVQSIVAGIALVLLRTPLATLVGLEADHAYLLGWLAFGVAMTVGGGAQTAVLAGLRRVGDIARLQIYSGLTSALAGIAALLTLGDAGIIVLVLALPTATFVMGWHYVARLPEASTREASRGGIWTEWRGLALLGLALMLGNLLTQGGHLTVRSIVLTDLGSAQLGYFQAAWALGMMYLTFVLTAMGVDYLPRLSSVIKDEAAAREMVNQQTEVALLLCGPVIVAMLGLAPWVVSLLYSQAFFPAVELLRWQLVGDVLKVVSWPMGYIIVARGCGPSFISVEAISSAIFVTAVYLLLPQFGLVAAGMAFVVYYLSHVALNWMLGGRHVGFLWDKHVLLLIAILLAGAIATSAIGFASDLAGAIFGILLSVALSIYALLRLASLLEETGKLASIVRVGRALCKRIAER